jgi:hypothetical protein
MNSNRLIGVVLTACIYASHGSLAWAQDAPAEGTSIAGALTLGRSTFALPPGEWKVVSSGSSKVNYIDKVGSLGADTAAVYLVQVDTDGTFVASMLHRVPLASSRVSSWSDSLCDRKDTLYRDTFSEHQQFPECLLINHIVRFWVTEPNSAFDKKIWDWFRVNKIRLPTTVLNCSYRKYFAGDYVSVAVWVNPENFGQPPSLKTVWAESEWHPNAIKSDKVRAAFVDGFKKWCYVMVESAKATLSDRKPKPAALPSFAELRLN